MSFRWKTVGLIGLIEATAFAILIVSVVGLVNATIEEQFIKRAETAALLFATSTENAVLAQDLASLEAFTEEVMRNPGLVYARVRGQTGILAERARQGATVPEIFKLDDDLDDVGDGVFDACAKIEIDGVLYGQVEIGLSTDRLTSLIGSIRNSVLTIGGLEILVSAIASFLFGGILVKRLVTLQAASLRMSSGELGLQVEAEGNDEIGDTARSFNLMSRQVSENVRQIELQKDAMAATLQRHHAVTDAALDAIVTIDAQGRVIGWNPAAGEIFGFTKSEVEGRDISRVMIPEKHREAHAEGMAAWRADGTAPILGQRIEIEALRKSGEVFPVELTVVSIPLGDGKTGFTAYLRDLSDAKAKEAALVAAKETAEAASRAKTDFLHVMSHELRTPLQGAKGPLEELAKQFDDFIGVQDLGDLAADLENPGHRQRLETALTDLRDEVHDIAQGGLRSAAHLLTLINEVLDMAKIESGKINLNLGEVSLDDAIAEAARTIRPVCEQKGLGLRTDVEPGLAVHGDGLRVNQVLLNLIGNAAKFTAEGSVGILARTENGFARIDVVDTGPGIPADKLETVFQAFEQVENALTRESGGTGLGLPITRKLVRLQGGEIRVESAEGQGSVFTFTLPLAAPSGQAQETPSWPTSLAS